MEATEKIMEIKEAESLSDEEISAEKEAGACCCYAVDSCGCLVDSCCTSVDSCCC